MLISTKIGVWQVDTGKNVFTINESDEHTAQMLADFKNNKGKLQQFENFLDQDPETAYNRYNNIAVDRKKKPSELHDEKAKTFAALMKSGNYEHAYYELLGLKKPEKEVKKL